MRVADSSESILELLRGELRSAGYNALVLEDELAAQGTDRSADRALDELLDRLRNGVVTAMLAHAESIRNLKPDDRPSRREPLGRTDTTREHTDLVIRLDADEASRIEEQARELSRLIAAVKGPDAGQG
jgi:hypothetical protein